MRMDRGVRVCQNFPRKAVEGNGFSLRDDEGILKASIFFHTTNNETGRM